MRRAAAVILLTFLSVLALPAQTNVVLKGVILEADSTQPVIQAAAQLLSPLDSASLYGTVTDNDGKFTLRASEGNYILKITYMGYETQFKTIHAVHTTGGIDLGTFSLEPATEFLEAATVAARVQPVTVVADTVVFNPAAYRLPEDASLADLLKKIPGLEVNGGSVTLYGKPVNELRIDGKLFFGGDVRAGLENLTADMVDKIHAYERESDFTQASGVDDGELIPVLDLKVKKDLLDGWHGDTMGSYGSSDRYSGRVNARKFTKNEQTTVLASANNVPSRITLSNATRTQLGGGSVGDIDRREAGLTLARDLKNGDFDGNIHYYGQSRDSRGQSQTQSILSSGGSFSNSLSNTLAWQDTPKMSMQIVLHPKERTTIMIKPQFSYSRNDSWSHNFGGNFKKDPYERVEDPTDYLDIGIADDPLDGIRNNSTDNMQQTVDGKFFHQTTATFSRRFGKNGRRSLGLELTESVSIGRTNQGTNYRTYYYKNGRDTTRRQFVDSRNDITTFAATVSYNEPFKNGYNLQFILRGDYKIKKYDKSIYDIASIDKNWGLVGGRSRDGMYASLPENYEDAKMEGVSSGGDYSWISQMLFVNMRRVKKKYNLTAGLKFNPQWALFSYPGEGAIKTMRTTVFNVAPNINYNYKPTNRKKLSASYRSYTEQPSVYNLLPVSSGTNPLYVHYGNPDLKPAFIHSMSLGYNTADIKKQSSFICNLSGKVVLRQASNSTIYDPDTGGKTVTPKNINGNWSASSTAAYNKTFSDNRFSLSEHFSAQYNNYKSFLYNSKKKEDDVNTTRRFMAKESLDGTFRNSWLEVTLNMNGQYTFERSLLRPDMNQDPWSVGCGLNALFILPSLTRLTVDYSAIAQRGFAYGEFNRNYNVLNLTFSQPLFKKKATLSLSGYDILGQLPNMTRSFGSETRSIGLYNGVNRYVMLRLVWRFKH